MREKQKVGQALYRKYRSRSFDELVGQDHITQTLGKAVAQGKISHAYLFTGPRGTGKTSIARILAHQINNLEYSDKPHLDIIEIDAASNRRIEDVRDLREKVHLAPVSATYKVYIIDEVHMLTTESFNALLKTLEEPPSHVVFILATTELHKLPATITSRTQRFAFAPPSQEVIVKHLAQLAKQEKLAISPEALALIAEHGDGSFRDSISLLDQVSSLAEKDKEISESDVASLLGLPPKTLLVTLLEATLAHQPKQAADALKKLEASGASPGTIALSLMRLAAQQADSSPQATQLLDALIDVGRSPYQSAKLLASVLTIAHNGSDEPRKQRAAPLMAAPKDTIIAEKPQPPKTSSKHAVQKVAAEPKTTPAAKPMPSGKNVAFDLDLISGSWGNVLAIIKKHSPPLFGTLKTAELRRSDTGALLLAFKFALYSRKIEDAKHKLVLVAALQEVTGIADISIECIVDAKAEPTPLTITAPPATAIAGDVMKMMGGGEVVGYSE